LQFIDLKSQYIRIRDSVQTRLDQVLQSGQFVNGPAVGELEQTLASMGGAAECVCCANGTDAILMALMALEVKPGDTVVSPAFTFPAAAEMTLLMGATPVLVDIDPTTYAMHPDSLRATLASLDTPPSAIVAVDLYGVAADYAAIDAIAAEYGVPVIADAAQSFGGRGAGRPIGSLAPITTTSFYPAKPLGSYGEGGAVLCTEPTMARILRSIREHGMGAERYAHVRVGINGRMHTMQAAVLLAKLEVFADEIAKRNAVARRYTAGLAGEVQTPTVPEGSVSVWAQYTIQVDNRDTVVSTLKEKGVPTAIHYPRPLHRQPAFSEARQAPGGMPNAERAAQRVLSLPMHPYLTQEDIAEVVKAVREVIT
jgi:dTDP-4-amino-4,6-dideoxygalactose transaminase